MHKWKLLSGIVVAFLLAFYLIWEVYWAIQVGYHFIKWHTHLMLYVYLLLIPLVFYRATASSRLRNLLLLWISILFAGLLAEAFLTAFNINKTGGEAARGFYDSPYHSMKKGYYHVWPPSVRHQLVSTEFSYWRQANSQGLSDREWSRSQRSGEKRVLALGDSFTEGDGAPYDSSYVFQLSRMLADDGDSVYMMNGGVCGSDPFNNYVILRDRLMPYHPDLIIQSLGSNDMAEDIKARGGLERFQPDSSVRYRSGPWWEPIYAISYVGRLFLSRSGYDHILRRRGLTPGEQGRINNSVSDLFRRYAVLCHQAGMACVIVLHPERDELKNNAYGYDFSPLLHQLQVDSGVSVVDLLPYYRAYLDSTHTQPDQYYWPHDGHHNSKGYQLMARATLQAIRPMLADSNGLMK